MEFFYLWVGSRMSLFVVKRKNFQLSHDIHDIHDIRSGLAKEREAKLCVKISLNFIFDAKLRFALLASLRSAIFSEIKVVN